MSNRTSVRSCQGVPSFIQALMLSNSASDNIDSGGISPLEMRSHKRLAVRELLFVGVPLSPPAAKVSAVVNFRPPPGSLLWWHCKQWRMRTGAMASNVLSLSACTERFANTLVTQIRKMLTAVLYLNCCMVARAESILEVCCRRDSLLYFGSAVCCPAGLNHIVSGMGHLCTRVSFVTKILICGKRFLKIEVHLVCFI